jgi:hypothetical protein
MKPGDRLSKSSDKQSELIPGDRLSKSSDKQSELIPGDRLSKSSNKQSELIPGEHETILFYGTTLRLLYLNYDQKNSYHVVS